MEENLEINLLKLEVYFQYQVKKRELQLAETINGMYWLTLTDKF